MSQSRHRRQKGLSGQPIGDDHQFSIRNAILGQSPCGRLRIANYAVTKPERSTLCAKLQRSQQVPELPVTANNYRYACETSGGRQHQVCIEIKRVSHRDLVPMERACQSPASAPILPSEKATT